MAPKEVPDPNDKKPEDWSDESMIDEPLMAVRQRSDGEVITTEPVSPSAEARNELDPFGSNILMMTDSYKVTHHLPYPPGTETIYSYCECRGGKFKDVCFFGLQYYVKKYLLDPVVTREKIDAAEAHFKRHFEHPTYGLDEKLFNKTGTAWRDGRPGRTSRRTTTRA